MVCNNKLFTILGGKWYVPILEEINYYHSSGFNDILNNIKIISPKILADHLHMLTNEKIIQRNIMSSDPLRVSYEITEKGKKMLKIILEIKNIYDISNNTCCATTRCVLCLKKKCVEEDNKESKNIIYDPPS